MYFPRMKLAPSDMFCFSLYAATHALQQAYRPLLAPLGLTYPQYLVLRALWTEGSPMTVGRIGKEVQLDSSTLTPLLKRMEAAGLISRRRDPRDERQVQIGLTPEGRALEAKTDHVPGCIVEKTGLALQDLTRLRDEINALTTHLQKEQTQ